MRFATLQGTRRVALGAMVLLTTLLAPLGVAAQTADERRGYCQFYTQESMQQSLKAGRLNCGFANGGDPNAAQRFYPGIWDATPTVAVVAHQAWCMSLPTRANANPWNAQALEAIAHRQLRLMDCEFRPAGGGVPPPGGGGTTPPTGGTGGTPPPGGTGSTPPPPLPPVGNLPPCGDDLIQLHAGLVAEAEYVRRQIALTSAGAAVTASVSNGARSIERAAGNAAFKAAAAAQKYPALDGVATRLRVASEGVKNLNRSLPNSSNQTLQWLEAKQTDLGTRIFALRERAEALRCQLPVPPPQTAQASESEPRLIAVTGQHGSVTISQNPTGGTKYEIDEKANALLGFADNLVFEGAVSEIQNNVFKNMIEMEFGSATVSDNAAGSRITMRTPEGTITPAGTVFVVVRDAAKQVTFIFVDEGSVIVTSAAGGDVQRVPAGEAVILPGPNSPLRGQTLGTTPNTGNVPPTGNACATGIAGFEYETNRYGGDYIRYAVTAQTCPQQCADACANDNRCQAWSFVAHDQVDPGCYLKNSVPAPTRNACCVSGLAAGRAAAPSYPPTTSTQPMYPPVSTPPPSVEADCPANASFEYATNRYGGDYQRYAVTAATCPQQCADACANDNRCQAWSFVRHDQVDPGCYLKNSVPAPTRNECCVSGTVARAPPPPPPPPPPMYPPPTSSQPMYPPVSTPPSGASGGCAGFAGTWNMTAFGMATIGVGADGSFAATYTNGGGTVQGRVAGNRLEGTWAQEGRSGQVGATLSADGASFACQWAENGQVQGDCNATCAGGVMTPPSGIAPPPPMVEADCGSPNPIFEYGTNRYGGDYARYAVTAQTCPQQCADACANDNRCQAWSFVRHDQVDPGCYLKSTQPAPTANPCCVSGTFTRIIDRVQPPVGGDQGGNQGGNFSQWLNRDSPGDSADYEDLENHRAQIPCPQPIAIECRVVGDGRDWRQTGQRYSCALDAAVPGGICINAENNGACLDYEVRFQCP